MVRRAGDGAKLEAEGDVEVYKLGMGSESRGAARSSARPRPTFSERNNVNRTTAITKTFL